MLVGKLGSFSSAGSALEVTFLYKKRFVHFFNGAGFFAHRSGNGGDSHWSALEFFNDGAENFIIHFIQAVLVHVQRVECVLSNLHIYISITFYLCKVAHTPE